MPARTAKELAIQAALKQPAKELLPLAQNARHYAELLIERKLWMDSIAFLSHAITPRESIWWGWFCTRKAALPKSDPAELKALSLAEAWIAQPNEENRLAAKEAMPKTPPGAAQSVLEAIYYTGEIENEVSGEKSPPVPYISSKFINAAVLCAVYELNANQPEEIAAEFLKQGMDVANRIQLWAHYT
ncbi:MAG: hypothetical protein FJW36_05630 [Acidobacteria bacterium]|nr:hypothetical protein [Acidobacteriota bacterium]